MLLFFYMYALFIFGIFGRYQILTDIFDIQLKVFDF